MHEPRDPSSPGRAFPLLAEELRISGELDEALELVRWGRSAFPELASGHLVAARIHRDRGESWAALSALSAALELDPENRSALREFEELSGAASRRVPDWDPFDASLVAPVAALRPDRTGAASGSAPRAPATLTEVDREVLPVAGVLEAGAERGPLHRDPGSSTESDPDSRPVPGVLPTQTSVGAESTGAEIPAEMAASVEASVAPEFGASLLEELGTSGILPDPGAEGAAGDWFVADGSESGLGEDPFPGPSRGVPTLTLVRLYEAQGRTDLALEVCLELESLRPGDPDVGAALRRLSPERGGGIPPAVFDGPEEVPLERLAPPGPEGTESEEVRSGPSNPADWEGWEEVPLEFLAPRDFGPGDEAPAPSGTRNAPSREGESARPSGPPGAVHAPSGSADPGRVPPPTPSKPHPASGPDAEFLAWLESLEL